MSGESIDEKYTKDDIVTTVKVSHDKIVKVNAKRVCKNKIYNILELESG